MATNQQLLNINYYYYNKTDIDRILNDYALKNHTHSQYLTNTNLNTKVNIAQGSDKALKNVVTDSNGNITTEAKPVIPTKISDLTNDQNFINSVNWTDINNKPSTFAPTSHTHGNLQNDGQVGSTVQADCNVVTDRNGKITTEEKPTIPTKTSDLTNDGDGTNIFIKNNDSRLTNTRTPTMTAIPANSDLDNYKTTGFYYCFDTPESITASTIPNFDNKNFYLIVENRNANNIKQTLTKYNDGKTWIRVCYGGVWEDWNEISFSTHTHGNLQSDGQIGSTPQPNKNIVTDPNGKIKVEDKYSHPTTHTTNMIIEPSTLTNIGITDTNIDQHTINTAINLAVGNLSNLNAIEIVETLPTESASTTGKLYIVSENDTLNIYYTKATTSEGTTTYTWEELGSGLFDNLDLSNYVTTDDNRLTNARTPTSHTHGQITNDGKIGSTANKPIITTTNGELTTGSFGTAANTFCQGNDSRLSNARTPTSHTHGNITNDGQINTSNNASKNIVTDAEGYITLEDKYTHPSYTARTGKPTANATPTFGSTFTVTQFTSDNTGHISGATDRTVKIPNTLANGTTAGLSTNDYTTAEKTKLGNIADSANNYTHPSYTARTGKPTANATPSFGSTFTVSQITSDATGHITNATDRTVKIPNALGNGTTAGLSTNDYTTAEKTKLDGIAESANNYSHPTYTARTGKPTANATPAFGSTFTISQITSDATGHVTGATDRTVKIPALPTANTSGTAGIVSLTDSTSTTSSTVAATATAVKAAYDKGNHSHPYLPLSGGTLTGNVVYPVESDSSSNTAAGNLVWSGTPTYDTDMWTTLKGKKSLIGTISVPNDKWYNVISVRHRNGSGDGGNYGIYIKSALQNDDGLIWAKQKGTSSFMAERTILDSSNYSTYANKTTVDTALSSSSTNPVQNKVINTALSGKAPTSHTDSNGAYGKATTSVWGHTKLNSATDSTDETTAATPKAVKAAYDKGNHNHPYISTTAGSVGTNNLANGAVTNEKLSATIIPNGTSSTHNDLNKYTTPGFYYQSANAETSYIDNLPNNTKLAFTLLVEKHTDAGVKQTLTFYNTSDPQTFIRISAYNSTQTSGWGTWKEIAWTSDIPSLSNYVTTTDSRLSNARTPTAHATTSTTYGGGTSSNYGHVKVSDNYTSSAGNASQSVAASSAAVKSVYDIANGKANSSHTHTWTQISDINDTFSYDDQCLVAYVNSTLRIAYVSFNDLFNYTTAKSNDYIATGNYIKTDYRPIKDVTFATHTPYTVGKVEASTGKVYGKSIYGSNKTGMALNGTAFWAY